jgi:hypothetical protein
MEVTRAKRLFVAYDRGVLAKDGLDGNESGTAPIDAPCPHCTATAVQ